MQAVGCKIFQGRFQ